MRHEIPVAELGPRGATMARAVESCVHCGFCLPSCPTYRVLGEEMDSPRGRIVLMKEVLEDRIQLDSALPYIDRCLSCLACVTACPSGVRYEELIVSFRGHAEERRRRSRIDRAFRGAVLNTLPHPDRAAPLARLGAAARPFGRWLPERLASPLALLPHRLPRGRRLPELVPARGTRRARVALLAGCIQQVVDPDINVATARVLSRNAVEVAIPRSQGCCGALAMHAGDQPRAREQARRTMAGLWTGLGRDVDAIVTNAAGCGAGMREYGLLFGGADGEMPLTGEAALPDEAAAARDFSSRVVDVSAFLDSLGLAGPPPELARPTSVAYHDACHLSHAQGVRAQPRRLLRSIPGLDLVEPADWELCCGSAGTYNLEQPAIATQLGERKARNLRATGAEAVVAGNVGCLVQIGRFMDLPLMHTMQALDRAYRGIPLA